MRAAFAALALCAAPAAAQEAAPRYLVEGIFASYAAQSLAVACPTLSIDPVAMRDLAQDTLGRFQAEGGTRGDERQRLEATEPEMQVLREAFLARHGLAEGAPAEEACAAGRTEMEEGSAIGALLVEVE